MARQGQGQGTTGRRGGTQHHGRRGSARGRLLIWLVAGAVGLAGCASDDVGDVEDAADTPEVEIDDEPAVDPIDPDDVVLTVATHADALEAMADSIAAGSWRWTGAVEMSLTDADFELLAEDDDSFSIVQMRKEAERYGSFAARGALGADGSWQTTWVHEGHDIVDLRLSGGELFDASTLEPEVTMLMRIDWPYLLTEFWDEIGYPGGPLTPEEELAELRREVEAELAGTPFQQVVLAILDSRWGGLSGVIDLASFGVTEQDLQDAAEEFREELIGLADRDTTLELIDRSVTLRDFTPVGTDGGSVAILDVHPEAAALAIYDLFDDAAALASDYDDDLPETLEAVATITFDGDGMMTEVSTDIMSIMRQVLELELQRGDEWASGITEEELAMLGELEGTAAVVFGFSDHGQVPTVLDVPDPITADWGDLAEFIADMFSTSGWEDDWEEEWDTGEWDEGSDWDEASDRDDGSAEPGTDPRDEFADPYDEFWACFEETGSQEDCAPLLEQ